MTADIPHHLECVTIICPIIMLQNFYLSNLSFRLHDKTFMCKTTPVFMYSTHTYPLNQNFYFVRQLAEKLGTLGLTVQKPPTYKTALYVNLHMGRHFRQYKI